MGDLARQRALARSTLYSRVAPLFDIGVVAKREAPGPPLQVFYEHGPNGAEFDEILRSWSNLLAGLPMAAWDAPLHFAEAWATGVVQALLDGPLPVAEVTAHCAGSGTGPQIERLLRQLRRAGFVVRAEHRHSLLDPARAAIGGLAMSARFEQRHMSAESAPISASDGVDALRGTLPLLALADRSDGLCEFVVRASEEAPSHRAAACWAEVRAGRVVACGSGSAPRVATSWVQGTIDDWFGAVIDRRTTLVASSGGSDLGRKLVRALHQLLYRYG